MFDLYLDNGYLNMSGIIESGFPFIFVPAARATGKTFGSLLHFIDKEKIMLLRRTQREADLQANADTTSYKDVFDHLNRPFICKKSNGLGFVTDVSHETPHTVAVCAALSTFASVRGMGFSEIDHIVYDEFIAEAHVKKFAYEGQALANLYESIDRNRQVKGKKPTQLLCLANAVNMANDVFMYFDLITHAEEMIKNLQEVKIIGNKLLIIPQKSPISEKKAQTALYKAVNSEFSDMAIRNKFILNDFTYVQERSLKEYTCQFQVGDLFVFRHKSKREYYITYQKGKTKNIYGSGYAALTKFRRDKWRFIAYYYDGLIRFQNYQSIALFEKYFDI